MKPEMHRAVHEAGCFIEGFDSILYNPLLRESNRYRFLAELYYGFIYDSRLVLGEPMVFDNQVMIRLLRKMQEKKLTVLHDAVRYVQFRPPMETQEATFLNPYYVCSAISEPAEEERKQRIRSLPTSATSPSGKLEKLLGELSRFAGLTEDDWILLENFRRGLTGDWPWKDCTPGNTKTGYKMCDQLLGWLNADDRKHGNSLLSQVNAALSDPKVYPPNGAKGLTFNEYFARRSLWHQTKSAWAEVLPQKLFGRIDEYVNSAYMEAIRRTCQAATSVQTPMSFADTNHVAAQSVINAAASAGGNTFEFQLRVWPQQAGGKEMSPIHLTQVENDLLTVLDGLYRDDGFTSAKHVLGALNRLDDDYLKRYVHGFGNLVDIVNAAGGPFKLLLDGTRAVTLIPGVSRCVRETAREEGFQEANGCEQKYWPSGAEDPSTTS